ncbi:MAG: hypothetical protein ACR2PR_03160 [Pseudohongiellaceae bacterium]
MVIKKVGIRPEEVKGGTVLYVEGTEDSIDSTVLKALLDNQVSVKPMESFYEISSVAKALWRHHPTYYFLIDRDHHSISYINQCWDNFPDPNECNLLIWKKREIENYFLDPDYLVKSIYFNGKRDELASKILRYANDRKFFDAANQVIVSIREELKTNWVEIFGGPSNFPDKKTALKNLKEVTEFQKYPDTVARKLSEGEIEERFNQRVENMTGGEEELTFGAGDWQDMIKGRPVLESVIHQTGYFRVNSADGKLLEGREKTYEIVKELLRNSDNENNQPEDFTKLKDLILSRIS